MKIIIYGLLLSLGLILSACGNEVVEEDNVEVNTPEEPIDKQEEDKPTQAELNEILKEEAVEADFVELNVDNPPMNKKVFVDGEITVVTENGALDEFIITSKENEDNNGVYSIMLVNTTDVEYSEGDQIRIYGSVDGKDEDGLPLIFATILEQK